MGRLVALIACIILTVSSGAVESSHDELSYRSAYRLEELRLYEQAYDGYKTVAKKLIKQHARRPLSVADTSLLISATFRLSMANANYQFKTFNKLIDQLEGFNETTDLINDVMGLLKSHPMAIPQSQYSHLLFARAYTQLGLSYKLLNGIAWKNYIVYPQKDILDMIDMAMLDLSQALMFQGVLVKPDASLADYEALASEKITALPPAGIEFQTLQRLLLSQDTAIMAKSYAKRLYQQTYEVVMYYQKKDVQDILAKAKSRTTLQEILSPSNKPIFDVTNRITKKLKLV